MRYLIWAVFILSFLVLNICLLMPLASRGMSWEEAALGLIPSGFVALVCFVLLLTGVGAKQARPRASLFWAAALLWSLLVGGVVTFTTMSNYQSNISAARSERADSFGRSSSSLYQAYARYDQIGLMFGWATLGFAGVSLLGLIASIAMPKPKTM